MPPRDPIYESEKGNRARSDAVALRRWIHERFLADPESLPGRFRYYEAIMAGVISKGAAEEVVKATSGEERTVTRGDWMWARALGWVRENGLVDDAWITDTTRNVIDHTGWPTLAAAVASTVEHAVLDPWGSVAPPLLVVESAASTDALDPIAARYRTRIAPLRGQAGRAFLANEVAALLTRDPVVLSVGDLDKAGGDIMASARERLERFAGRSLDWRHIALTDAQVGEFGIVRVPRVDKRERTNPVKRMVAETEALGAANLRRIVSDALDGLLPVPLVQVQVREDNEREVLRARLRDDAI